MALKPQPQQNSFSGTPTPLSVGAPKPFIAKRDPTSADTGFPFGQTWINKLTNSFWVLTSVAAGLANWEPGGGSATVETITGDSGGAISPAAGNINILGGTGCNTVGSGSTLTINVTGLGEEYTTVTADTPMSVNQGYITNKGGSAATMTLPATSAVGSAISIIGRGATGWVIAQNAGQSIHMNSVTTTVGVGGSLASSAQYNAVDIVCTVADT